MARKPYPETVKAVTPGAKTCSVKGCIRVATIQPHGVCRECYEEYLNREIREELAEEFLDRTEHGEP